MKTFYINIDETNETGLSFISFVSEPAIGINFLSFSSDNIKQIFSIEDDKHIVFGPALIPDMPIYRCNNGYEYNVVFTKDAIKKMVEKYSASGLFNSVDEQHNEKPIQDVVMIESFIIDRDGGINPKQFEDIADGSWIVKFKINNEDLWNDIKSGKVKGFSVAGTFNISEEEFNANEDKIDVLIKYLIED